MNTLGTERLLNKLADCFNQHIETYGRNHPHRWELMTADFDKEPNLWRVFAAVNALSEAHPINEFILKTCCRKTMTFQEIAEQLPVNEKGEPTTPDDVNRWLREAIAWVDCYLRQHETHHADSDKTALAENQPKHTFH